MITALGELAINAILPLVTLNVTEALAAILSELLSLEADASALVQDLAAFQTELAGVQSDLAALTTLATDLQARLTHGATGLATSVQAAIDSLTSGQALIALQQTLAGGLAALLASVQSAYTDIVAKAGLLGARATSLLARVASVQARIVAIATRLASLTAIKTSLIGIKNLLATSGVHLYRYDGATADFGNELQAEIGTGVPGGTGTDVAYGLVLVTTSAVSWAGLAAIFKTVP